MDLRTTFEHRSGRVIAVFRVALSLVFLAALAFEPADTGSYISSGFSLIGSYLVLALVDADFTSPFLALFALTVLSTTLRWDWAMAARTGMIAPDLIARARQQSVRRRTPSPFATLIPRERTIVALAMHGTHNREIAGELGITEGTVKVYLHALYQKLGVDNRTELAVMALSRPGEFA